MTAYASRELAERAMNSDVPVADVVDDRMDNDGNMIEDWFGNDEHGNEIMWYAIVDQYTGNTAYMTRDDAVSRNLRVDWN